MGPSAHCCGEDRESNDPSQKHAELSVLDCPDKLGKALEGAISGVFRDAGRLIHGLSASFLHHMARFDFIATYIMANRKNGAIYTGCASDLPVRVGQHKQGVGSKFTAKYKCNKLVWFERFDEMAFAVRREKQIKRWPRQWKINLIEQTNPIWLDRSKDLL